MHRSSVTARARLLAPTALLLLAGCAGDAADEDGALRLVATTGHVHDALVRITDGVDVELVRLCGPGVDPHSFRASTADVQAMQDADAVLYNGYHLEAQLDPLLREGAIAGKTWAMASAFPHDARLDWVEDGEVDPDAPFDPHIWNHLPGWAACVEALAAHLGTVDPDRADTYAANGAVYAAEILEAHEWAVDRLAQLPEGRRVLVSGHDAFNYFAQAYGLETGSVLGIGNEAEPDVRAIRETAETIVEREVPVIFLESITNPKITTALQEACAARGWRVSIATERLYSDDLGEHPPQDTYLGAFRSNVEIVHDSLAEEG